MKSSSLVLAFPPPTASQSEAWLREKLSYYADAWDVAEDLANGIEALVVLDVRSAAQYQAGHISGAVSFPHRLMTPETLAKLNKDLVYITYCDGIGCNGSTKGAWKLAQAGFRVKELIGGLDVWRRDGHPVTTGEAAGDGPLQEKPQGCGC